MSVYCVFLSVYVYNPVCVYAVRLTLNNSFVRNVVGEMATSVDKEKQIETVERDIVCFELPAPSGWSKKVFLFSSPLLSLSIVFASKAIDSVM